MRANLAPKLTTKFLETITPLVKQSLKDAISGMVISGLSRPVSSPPQLPEIGQQLAREETSATEDILDTTNPKIVTTVAEQKILAIIKDMVSGVANEEDIVAKDTESYYTVLYQNKTNRWIVRYIGDKKDRKHISLLT